MEEEHFFMPSILMLIWKKAKFIALENSNLNGKTQIIKLSYLATIYFSLVLHVYGLLNGQGYMAFTILL